MITPVGGARLLDVRKHGMRPDGYVAVSLVGPLRVDFPVLQVPEGARVEELDLRMLVDLSVLVFHVAGSFSRHVALANACIRAGVRDLEFLDAKSERCICIMSHYEKWIKEVPPPCI